MNTQTPSPAVQVEVLPRFKIGDTAWVARAGPTEKWIICPDCFGKKFLTVILGDGSQVTIDCVCCERGWEGCRGAVQSWDYGAVALEIKIDGMEIGRGQPTKYMFNKTECSWNNVDESDLFATKTEALAKADELREEHEAKELHRLNHLKHDPNKKWAWNATYHRRCLKDALRNVEYHTKKLDVAKSHAKEVETKEAA